MKTSEIEVWSEGYAATGERGEAVCHGVVKAASLREACDALAKRDRAFRAYYDPERMTFWGCRLFDNEESARRSFG